MRKTLQRTKVLGLLLAPCLGTLSGCAYTEMQGFRDPDYANAHFNAIMVEAPVKDLRWRSELEKRLADLLNHRGVSAFVSTSILPPTRDYSPQDREQILKQRGIDSVLEVDLTSYTLREDHSAPTQTTETKVTQTEKNQIEVVSQTEQQGEEITKTAEIKFDVKLIDEGSQKTAWTASSYTHDGVDSPFDFLWGFGRLDVSFGSFAQKTVDSLHADGLIP